MVRLGVIAALVLCAASLAACSRSNDDGPADRIRASTVVEPETRVDAVPQEEPGVARFQWRAVNDVARTVSGNLRVSIEDRRGGPVTFAFANGVTVRAQVYAVEPADSRSGVGGQSFAAVLGGDPRVSAYLYRVLNENVSSSAVRGGLCGEATTRYMAVSEFVDGSGRWVFKVAAFSGAEPPPSGEDPQLCNAYSYTSQ